MEVNLEKLNNKAIDKLNKNRLDEARFLFERGAEEFPGIESYNNLAWFYLNEDQDVDYALAVIESINFLYVESYMTYALYGDVLMEDGNYEEAIKQYKSSSYIEEDRQVYHNIGVAYFMLEDYENAGKYFLKAYEYKLEYSLICYFITLAYLDKEELKRELELKKELLLDEDLLIAELYYEIDDFKNAENYFQKALEEYDVELVWLYKYLDSLYRNGKIEEMYEVIEEYLDDYKELKIILKRLSNKVEYPKIDFNNFIDLEDKIEGYYLYK